MTAQRYGVDNESWSDYDVLPARASDCIECGDCMERCPFGVDMISKMREMVEFFES